MTLLRDRLLAWYDRNARDLPWRRRRDPWATWVSEIMLQQTRVEAVRTAYERFLDRFPRPADFAAATDDDLLRAWQGLGYYRRARLLREGARQVVDEHGGAVPSDPTALGALAGIGAYTRGAIASIAFGHAEPAIDGNVERVFARHAGIEDPIKQGPGRRHVERLVRAELEDNPCPGDFNQALMDLGATICTPRSPECGRCPVARDCDARAAGRTGELPVLPARRAAVPVAAAAFVIRDGARVLAGRIADGEINAGQLELPGPGILVDAPDLGAAIRGTEERHGFRPVPTTSDPVAAVRHGITHHRIRLRAWTATLGQPGITGLRANLRFVDERDPAIPWSTPSRKALAEAARGDAR